MNTHSNGYRFPIHLALVVSLVLAGFSPACQTRDAPGLRGRAETEVFHYGSTQVREAALAVLREDGFLPSKVNQRAGWVEALTPVRREWGGDSAQRHARLRWVELTPEMTEVSILFSRIEEGETFFSGRAVYQKPIGSPAEHRRFFDRLKEILAERDKPGILEPGL